jgi:hypothetical protein
MSQLASFMVDRLKELGLRLIDQRNARVLVPALGSESGFWFGGGNLVQDRDGTILACGRFRNQGDARTGTGSGARGLEFAVFTGSSPDAKFTKALSFSKNDLSANEEVVSIEGASLIPSANAPAGWELFVSTEKRVSYPKPLINFQKPGTGVWSIDRIKGSDGFGSLSPDTIETVASSQKGETLHVKDPVVFRINASSTELAYCHHPFSWASSNTGLSRQVGTNENFELVSENILPRGNSWDVACSRLTERLPIPKIGPFSDIPVISLYFYDGAECLRPLDQNPKAAKRPRGYSCEELGGLAWGWDHEFPKLSKISCDFPLFLSPHSTGCSRYASALFLDDGSLLGTWQQVQEDGSQPLVSNHVDKGEVTRILGA